MCHAIEELAAMLDENEQAKKKAAMKADEKIPSVVDVREKVRAFLSLLDAGEAGCSTWWEAIVDTGQDVRAMLDKVLPPRRGEAE